MKRLIVDVLDVDVEKIVTAIDVEMDTPIFAKKDGMFAGMVVHDGRGWVLNLGGTVLCSGRYRDRNECLIAGINCGYDFFVENRTISRL